MSNSPHLCVLITEIVGGDRLATRLGEEETTRAVERCLNRVDLAIGGNDGEIVARDRTAIIATFTQCDNGILAACEAVDRVRKLPPVSGTQMLLRVGVHYGEVENGMGEGVDGARMILLSCNADQSLTSTLVVDNLEPAVRKFVSAEAFRDDGIGELPWPVFMIGHGQQSVLPSALSLRPDTGSRPEPSSPLTSLKPSSASRISTISPAAQASVAPPSAIPLAVAPPPVPPPPAAQPSPILRMRLKHQQDTLFIDGSRPVILLGRELGNDIVIIDPRASRQHARIERRRKGFVLIDESTNGCFVAINGQEEQCLKGAELPLTSSGRFGCGFSSQEVESDLVFFELV